MVLHPAQIQEDPVTLSGDLAPDQLELDDHLARAHAPIQVQLNARREGEDIFVTGSLRTQVEVLCGRCGEWMEWPIEVKAVEWEFIAPTESTLHLTPYVREDILLCLPLNAACELDQKYRCPRSGKKFPPKESSEKPIQGKETWKALEQLKKKLKD